VIAPVLAALLCALGLNSYSQAGPLETYTVDGKEVSKQVFDAQRLANEGAMFLKAGEYTKALAKLEEAMSLAPELGNARYNLGLTLGKLGRIDEAIEQIEKSLATSKDLAPAWLSLAGLYQSQGKLPQAIATYKNFVKQFPQRPEVPRVTSILQLLERQLAKQTGSPQQPNGGTEAENDYLTEVTRSGIRRWPDSRIPLKIFIESGRGVPGFRPSLESTLKQCFLDWATASNGRLNFLFLTEATSADITCAFTNDRKRLRNPAEGAEALTYDDHHGNLVKARIILMTMSLNTDKPRSDNQMRLIGLHEIGHALGLGGHSTIPGDVMFYSSSFADTHRSPSERDRNTLTRLYSLPPGTGIAAGP